MKSSILISMAFCCFWSTAVADSNGSQLDPKTVGKVQAPMSDSNVLAQFRESPNSELFMPFRKFKVRTVKEAEVAGLSWVAHQGLLAEESLRVVGLHRASRRTSEYKNKVSWLWELRLIEFGTRLSGVILINAKNGEVYAAIPRKDEG